MKLKQESDKIKKPYEKPILRVIELETDQVLGVGCKLDSGGTSWGDPNTCIANFCSEPGS